MTEHEEQHEEKNFEDELKSIKDEMKELKELLKKKAKEEAEEEEINIGEESERSKSKKKGGIFGNLNVEFDDEDFKFDGVDETLGSYLGSVMEGVAQNLSASMKQMASGFQINIAEDLAQAKHDLKKNKHHIKREMQKVEREAKRAAREAERAFRDEGRGRRHTIRFQSLSDEEVGRFYELAPDLTSALSDEKKLKLLKHLENGPMYQKDLSEETEIKGGTFKHHMDALLEVKYVQQEAVRGRYLITQLGVEALKLSEMLFRRYVFATEENVSEREEEHEVEVEMEDEDLGAEIDGDINSDADAVDDLQSQIDEEDN